MKHLLILMAASIVGLNGLACDALDGGLVPVEKLPAPTITPDTSDTISGPAVVIVSPAEGATVDADWIPVSLELTGFAFDATHAVALTVISAAGGDPVTTLVSTPSAVLSRVPAGAVTIRATLVEGGEPLAIFAEVEVMAARTQPAVAITAPANGGLVPTSAASLEVALAVTDFTLLADGAAPTGPRQGRVVLTLDGVAQAASGSATTQLTLPATGEHTLTATLVDAAGVAWDATTNATSTFVVAPPAGVAIVAPVADETVQGARLTIVIAPDGFVTDGANTPGHGTFAVTLDGQLVLTKRTGTQAILSGLGAGEHTLVVELTTWDGLALVPPVSTSVTFDSELLPPRLDLVLPTGTTVKAGPQKVAVLPHHFSFSSLPIPGPLVPATGAWQLLVDDVIVAPAVSSAQTTVVLAPGTRELTARLVDMGGYPLDPSVEATRTLEVRPLATAVSILAPVPAATVAKRFAVAVGFEDFTLSGDVLDPGQPVVPGVGHFHAFLRKVPATTYDYQGFFLTETFELEVAQPGTYDLKVALHYQNHDPVLPVVEDEVRFEVDGRAGVRILSPLEDGRIGPSPFAVAVQVDNFELVPIGEVSTVRGHYHLFIDGGYQGFYLTPTAILDPATTTPPLTAGTHTLTAFLHDSAHNAIPGTLGDSVDFAFDPNPAVRIVSPESGTRVSTDPFVVAIEVDDLRLVDKAGQAPVAGEGHVHVFVDNAYIDFETSHRFELAIDDPGNHTIKVTLHDNDHAAIEGAAPAFVNVLVDPTPRVRFVAPSEGSFAYAGAIDVMLRPLNHAGEVELTVDDVVVYVGDPLAVDPLVLGEGMHVVRAMPVDDAGAQVVGSVVETVHFEVVGLEAPTVTWVSPAPNATVVAGQALTIGVSNFTLAEDLGRRPAVPGDGLWTFTVGDRVYGPFATPTVALPALPRGAATLVAELWHRDGSRVMPRRVASLPVTIGGTAPAVSLRSPTAAGQWFGPTVELAVDVSDFELGPDTGWLSIVVDGGQVGLAARGDVAIGPFAPGLHTLEVELVDADRAPLVPPARTSGTFRVGGAEVPTVAITSPNDGATLSNNGVAVSFAVGDLVLDAAAIGGPPQPGRGAVLVFVDGRVTAIAGASPVTITGLASGRRRIELVLAGLDLVPIAPAVADAIEVIVP